MTRTLPGLALVSVIGVLAIAIARVTPAALSAVLVALVVGLAIANLQPLPDRLSPGVDLAAKRILRIGVALLGARLTLGDVVAIGGTSLLLVLATMTAAFVTVAFVGHLAGISPELGILIGTGTAVCGNSAIAAAAPIIEAEDRQVSYAVATITTFGTIALVVFPLIGRAVGIPDAVFGVWVGLAINDTSQVVAAGAAYSEVALEHATVVKLVRNALMGPILIGLTLWMGRRPSTAGGGDRRLSPAGLVKTVRSSIPGFVLGFILLAGLRTAGWIGPALAGRLTVVSGIAIVVAVAGIGLKTRISELEELGPQPVVVGLAAASVLAVVALPLAYLVAG